MSQNNLFAGKYSFQTSADLCINLVDAQTGELNLASASSDSPNPQNFNLYGDPTNSLWFQSEGNRSYVTFSDGQYFASQTRGAGSSALFKIEIVSGSTVRIIQDDGGTEYYLSANGDKLGRIAKSASPPASTEFVQNEITPAQLTGTNSQVNFIGIYFAGTDISSWSSNGRTLISDCDLSFADLTGAIIKDVNFSFSNLTGADFSNTLLDNTNFSQVKGTGTIFTGVTFYNTTSFSSAKFDQLKMDDAKNATANPKTNDGPKMNGQFAATNSVFNGSNLAGSTLQGDFTGSHFISVNMENSVLTTSNFTSCVMTLISFAGTGENAVTAANSCTFDKATLSGANFDSVNLESSTFKGAILSNAQLDKILGNVGIDISGANFTGANLNGLDLSVNPPSQGGNGGSVTLDKNTNFTKAQMNGVNLSGQTLDNSNFLAASLKSANLTNCSFNSAILVGADMSDATFTNNTSFEQANMSNAILSNCDLTGAVFSADTSGRTAAILTNVYMPNAILTDAKLYAVNMAGCSWYGPSSVATNAKMEQVNLSNANIATLDLSQADMLGAVLTFANCVNTNFTAADLQPTDENRASSLAFASLQGATFTQAKLVDADLTNAAVSLNIQSSTGSIYGTSAFIIKGDGETSALTVVTDLNGLIIDKYLISQFEANGVTITSSSGVSILSTGSLWLLRATDEQQYILTYQAGENQIQVLKQVPEAGSNTTTIEYGAFVAVPLFQLPTSFASTLNEGELNSDLKTQFSNNGYALLDSAGATVIKSDDRWAISNRNQDPNELQSGYAQFVLLTQSIGGGSINFIQVYGTNPLVITRTGSGNKLTASTLNFNSTTVFDATIMGPNTTCPSGLKFELLNNGVSYEELMTAGLPPGPPSCIPSPTHWC